MSSAVRPDLRTARGARAAPGAPAPGPGASPALDPRPRSRPPARPAPGRPATLGTAPERGTETTDHRRRTALPRLPAGGRLVPRVLAAADAARPTATRAHKNFRSRSQVARARGADPARREERQILVRSAAVRHTRSHTTGTAAQKRPHALRAIARRARVVVRASSALPLAT